MATGIDVPPGAVVVGTDGSPPARRAVDWAVEEAVRRNAPLLIAYAPEWTTMVVGGARPVPPAELTEMGERMVGDEVERVSKQHPDLTVTGAAVPGRASVVLVDASARAEMVVVGARGAGPLTGPLLGSVSQKVAAHAQSPVVIVREEAPAEMPGPVVVGADPVDPPVEALEYAFSEAGRRGVGVVVVAAGQQPRTVFPTAQAATSALARLTEEAQERLSQDVDRLATEHGVQAEVRQLAGYPADAILAVAGADSFIVVGSRGHSGLVELLLGSISRAVIYRALAVAVVRVKATDERAA